MRRVAGQLVEALRELGAARLRSPQQGPARFPSRRPSPSVTPANASVIVEEEFSVIPTGTGSARVRRVARARLMAPTRLLAQAMPGAGRFARSPGAPAGTLLALPMEARPRAPRAAPSRPEPLRVQAPRGPSAAARPGRAGSAPAARPPATPGARGSAAARARGAHAAAGLPWEQVEAFLAELTRPQSGGPAARRARVERAIRGAPPALRWDRTAPGGTSRRPRAAAQVTPASIGTVLSGGPQPSAPASRRAGRAEPLPILPPSGPGRRQAPLLGRAARGPSRPPRPSGAEPPGELLISPEPGARRAPAARARGPQAPLFRGPGGRAPQAQGHPEDPSAVGQVLHRSPSSQPRSPLKPPTKRPTEPRAARPGAQRRADAPRRGPGPSKPPPSGPAPTRHVPAGEGRREPPPIPFKQRPAEPEPAPAAPPEARSAPQSRPAVTQVAARELIEILRAVVDEDPEGRRLMRDVRRLMAEHDALRRMRKME